MRRYLARAGSRHPRHLDHQMAAEIRARLEGGAGPLGARRAAAGGRHHPAGGRGCGRRAGQLAARGRATMSELTRSAVFRWESACGLDGSEGLAGLPLSCSSRWWRHARPAGRPGRARLAGSAPCAGAAGFTCSTLSVPLDHSGRVAGRLDLRVAAGNDARAPRGVLVLLTGGPGQPGVPFAGRLSRVLGSTIAGYRLVMFDQRGTGSEALRCPALQSAMGQSDLRAPPARAVRDCGAAVGAKRRFFSTADPAGDLAAVVRARHDGAELLDTLVTLSVADPTFTGVPEALHEARQGQPARLDRLVAAVRQG